MQEHPFIESMTSRIAGITAGLVAWVIYALLLVLYGNSCWQIALMDSFVSVGTLAICGFLFWYVTTILQAFQAQLAFTLLVQIASVTGGFLTQWLLNPDIAHSFALSLPLRLTVGLPYWIILAQWYHLCRIKYQQVEEDIQKEEEEIKAEKLLVPAEELILDRISVKDGSRIHIIHLNELLYIQASGDYVILFTASGQYIKEQTMKYFELHLPVVSFIRIHRSCIVNTEQITRVELFGKETYQVRLKNNDCLRVSNAGYKVLKERLSL